MAPNYLTGMGYGFSQMQVHPMHQPQPLHRIDLAPLIGYHNRILDNYNSYLNQPREPWQPGYNTYIGQINRMNNW